MRWDYYCEKCNLTEERDVPYDERDNQVCKCGAPMKRLFNRAIHFVIPPYMRGTKSLEIDNLLYGETREERQKSEKLYQEKLAKDEIVRIKEPLTPQEMTSRERKAILERIWEEQKEQLSRKRM